MNVNLTPGYLIHSRPFKESSMLVEFFTLEQGRISALVRGAKRPRSPYKGVLQPFQPLVISARGRCELLSATHIEVAQRMWMLTAMSLFSGLYLNELLMRLLPRHEVFANLYRQYELTLESLTTNAQATSLSLRVFEKHLLTELGYGINFSHDSLGRALAPQAFYGFDPNHGLVLLEPHQKPSIQGQTLLNFEQQGQVTEHGLKELKWLFRKTLHWVLGGQPLKTRELVRQLGA